MPYASIDTVTEIAATRWREKAHDPRLGQLMGSLIEHLHGFARENRLTNEEWFAACQFLARVGQTCTDKRQEFILGSDTIGLSMLVNLLNDHRPEEATQSTLLGPFYMPSSPEIAYGGRLPHVADDDGEPLFISGKVLDLSGTPLAGAIVDVWQTDHEGVYEAELPDCDEFRHRAIMRSRDDGSYMFRTVVPSDYPVPSDGPVGELLGRTAISIWRPAHIHFVISVDGHQTLVTHVFDAQSPFLETDVVYGVRDKLLLHMVRQPAGTAPNGDAVDRPYAVAELNLNLPPA